MSPLRHVESIREKYLEALRRAIHQSREKGELLDVEVAVRPDAEPGRAIRPMTFDLVTGTPEEPKPVILMNDALEGPLIGAVTQGTIEIALFPVQWEACRVWLRHPDPDWRPVQAWFDKWFDRTGRSPDEDGLHGVVHFMSEPEAEGGGYVLETDLGSAPLEAFSEFLSVLGAMGASEVRIGISDGSDMDPRISEGLRSPELTPATLTTLVAELLRSLEEVEKVEVPEEMVLRVTTRNSKDASTALLSNLWRRIQRVPPEQRPQEVARFIRMQREAAHHASGGAVKPGLEALRPIIKDALFIDQVRQQTKRDNVLAWTPFVGDLWILYVWDMPNGMQFLLATEPAELELTLEQIHRRAIDNYLASPRSIDAQAETGGVIVARTHDNYDASLLLDDGFWNDMAKKLPGDLLAAVPTRDVVLISSTGTAGGEERLRTLTQQQMAGGDHLISRTILRRTVNTWQVHRPLPAPVPSPTPAKSASSNATLPPAPPAASPPPHPPAPSPPPTAASAKPWWKIW